MTGNSRDLAWLETLRICCTGATKGDSDRQPILVEAELGTLTASSSIKLTCPGFPTVHLCSICESREWRQRESWNEVRRRNWNVFDGGDVALSVKLDQDEMAMKF